MYVSVNFDDVELWIVEKQGPMSPILVRRTFDDFDTLRRKFFMS